MVAAITATIAAGAGAQDAPEARADAVLDWVVAHARAHPRVQGPLTVTRHDRAFDRTVTERGRLVLTPEALRVSLTEPTPLELAARADRLEVFDGPSATLITAEQPTPVEGYALLSGDAGVEVGLLVAPRVLRDGSASVVLELVPRGAHPWLDVDRIVLRVDVEGRDRGRVERALVTWPTGDWARLELGELAYPPTIDARLLELTVPPGAQRVPL